MIDIHAHILPGVDDGSPDMIDSLLLAEMAVESGVDTIIATPHSHARQDAREHMRRIGEAFRDLRREISSRGIPLVILPGMEIFCCEDLAQRFEEETVLSLNRTDRYLIEFAFEEDAAQIRRYIRTVLDRGGRPVIAHPERYICLQRDLSLAGEWISLGCQLQMNKDSVFGAFGRKARRTALRLLKARQYAYVASDAHSPYGRTTHMGGIREYLEKKHSPTAAERLLERNARSCLLSR
jgi:protein-tyrosine phosphatase